MPKPVASPSTPRSTKTLLSYFTTNGKSSSARQTEISSSPAETNGVSECPWGIGDLIWAKMSGFPWWPSIVCHEPGSLIFTQGNGPKAKIHVQFFGDPPTRGWIRMGKVERFSSKTRDDVPEKFYSKQKDWSVALDQALNTVSMTSDERYSQVLFIAGSSNGKHDTEMSSSEIVTPETTSSKKRSALTASGGNSAKRKRLQSFSEEEDDRDEDFKPDASASSDDSDEDEVEDMEKENTDLEDLAEIKATYKAKAKRKLESSMKSSKTSSKRSMNSSITTTPKTPRGNRPPLSSFVSAESPSIHFDSDEVKFKHLSYDFLQDGKRKDAEKRLHTHTDYDRSTLLVPDHFLREQPPGVRQWWEFKARYFDTILLFKLGKFYELYHMDAVTGVQELGLTYMKGDFAHAGFPEISFGRYSEILVSKGYKVARIEQTETPEMLKERKASAVKGTPASRDKVVRRELCRIITPGTQTCGYLDGEMRTSQPAYLLAVCEREIDSKCSNFGVCFVDTTVGQFQIGQFQDDEHCSRLRTLIAHFPPAQVLLERNKVSPALQLVCQNSLTGVLTEHLRPGSQFWSPSDTLKCLAQGGYFSKDSTNDAWPEVIKKMQDESDSLGLTAQKGYELAVSSLGACVWYLKQCLIEHDMLSMKNMVEYVPVDSIPSVNTSNTSKASLPKRMILDAITLQNLDVTCNSNDPRSTEGSLLNRLDLCGSPFGKRLFRQWLCSPLCEPNAIRERQDVVSDFIDMPDFIEYATQVFKSLPDLERLLQKIHTMGSKSLVAGHPDSRAILFEQDVYSKRKIDEFLSTLAGFKKVLELLKRFSLKLSSVKSPLLRRLLTVTTDGGLFPELKEDLEFFDKAFDHEQAKTAGTIIPSEGADEEYDECCTKVKEIEDSLQEYLAKQRKILKCSKVTYFGTGRNRFQLEVPEEYIDNVPHEYEFRSQRKGFKRYGTQRTDLLLAELTKAEDERESCLRDIMRRIFANFDERYDKWRAAVDCLSYVEVLLSFARYARNCEVVTCKPEIVHPDDVDKPFIEIRAGIHPCAKGIFVAGDFIPNDTFIGIPGDQWTNDSSILLITGPNMGGKSTLMRQVSLLVIMAQMGCYVPAEVCRMTPVDRLFTRLGARDKIMAGQSTFFVEMSECSSIIRHATPHSLILMDELGRGTATHDGTAIAFAVLKFIADRIKCRTLFSTHYHSLVEDFAGHSNVALGHMSCIVENENIDDPTEETVTFLYKFVSGACPKSYGFHAAKLAGIPLQVIKAAYQQSRRFESSRKNADNLRKLREAARQDTVDDEALLNMVKNIVVM